MIILVESDFVLAKRISEQSKTPTMLSRYAYPIQMGLEVVPAVTEEDRGHPGQVGTVLGLTHRDHRDHLSHPLLTPI